MNSLNENCVGNVFSSHGSSFLTLLDPLYSETLSIEPVKIHYNENKQNKMNEKRSGKKIKSNETTNTPNTTTTKHIIHEMQQDRSGLYNKSKSSKMFFQILIGVLYLINGHLHEAHQIVNTYSVDESKHLHALVHRSEGDNIGELGLNGFSNSKYWFNQISPTYDWSELKDYCTVLLEEMNVLGVVSKSVQSGSSHKEKQLKLKKTTSILEGLKCKDWSGERFVELLEVVLQNWNCGGDKNLHHAKKLLFRYCERVQIFEIKMLMNNCLSRLS